MQHFPKKTESARAWCNRCNAFTAHKVWNGVMDKHHCIPCVEKQEAAHQERLLHPEPPKPIQQGLFA